jgi:hypothetical protein
MVSSVLVKKQYYPILNGHKFPLKYVERPQSAQKDESLDHGPLQVSTALYPLGFVALFGMILPEFF